MRTSKSFTEKFISNCPPRRLVDATAFQLVLSRARPASQRSDLVETQIAQVSALASAACKLFDTLKQGARNRAIAHTATAAIVFGLGGVVLMAVDVGAEAFTEGAATPIAGLSVHFGIEMVSESTRESVRLIELITAR